MPADVKIRYLLTSNDVLHAWWVPDFAVKKDAIPGFINEGWFEVNEPGIYRGQCAELCGKDHGFMPVVVEVLPKENSTTWLLGRTSQQTDRHGRPSAGAPSEASTANQLKYAGSGANLRRRRSSRA